MKKEKKTLMLAVLIAAVIGMAVYGYGHRSTDPAVAGRYPAKEIYLICAWPPGGSSDLISRAVAKAANKHLVEPIIVVNREGANGATAITQFVRTPADGYTIALGVSGLFTAQPYLQKNLGYRQEDFEFLQGLTNEPILLTVKADSPFYSLEELINAAKNQGMVIKYGNSGIGGIPQLTVAYLAQLANFQSQPIAFKGSSPALAAVLGGQVDLCVVHPGEALALIKAGKLRALAISSVQRFSELPDVPTLKEKGFNIDMGVKKFLLVPKGLPEQEKAVLSVALQKAVQDEEFMQAMKEIGVMVEPAGGQEVLGYLNTQKPIMEKLINDMKK
ncbi:MAG: tripartite tricarboxylate transporter substrate binding protein [Anaerolineaceae bacterium]|nr:tripartite tricarboxylate transporter substrate binding protein [Anaerolineaceae bacterium]